MSVHVETSLPASAPTLKSRRRSPYGVLLLVLALAYAALGLQPLGDPDVWWHLRTGELVVKSGFTTADPWSHASSNPWLLHEWGSEVIMYLSYAAGGYRGVILLHSLALLALAVVLLRSIRREADPGIAVVVGFLALVGIYLGTAERPQLVSWCLLAGVLPMLRRSVAARRPPWWLIPVTWLWSNLHGLWAAVLVLFGFLVIGLIIEVGVRNWRSYRQFLLVGILSTAAAALTPNGPALLLAPLHVREYAPFVTEWKPPSVLSPFTGCAFLLLAIVAITWARSRRVVPASEIALVVGACLIGLAYIRTVPITVIALAPVAAAGIQHLYHARPASDRSSSRLDFAIQGTLSIVFLAAAAAWLPQVPPIKLGAPFKASATLDALPGRAKVLNEYVLGGWLLWTARDTSPAIDGRTEIYAPEYVAAALEASRMGGDWQAFLSDNDFDAVWLDKDAPLVYTLTGRGWQERFTDGDTVILVPPS